MNTPKTIGIHQVATVPADEVRPGHILAEGIVLEVYPISHKMFGYRTPTATVGAAPGETVQVYAAITEDMAEAAREAYDARSER